MMVGVGIKLALELGERLDLGRLVGGIGIRFGSGKAVNIGILCLQGSEHVVERSILHHQDDDVGQIIKASWHKCLL